MLFTTLYAGYNFKIHKCNNNTTKYCCNSIKIITSFKYLGDWRNILKQIIACIKFFAEHNNAFRGTNSKLLTAKNGKYLDLVLMITKFDIIMAVHLKRVHNDESLL